MVSGVSVQVLNNREQGADGNRQKTVCPLSSVICFLCSVISIFLTPDTRHLKPTYYGYFFRIR